VTGPTLRASLISRLTQNSFTAHIQQFFVPTLSANDVAIMDNLSSHKRPAICDVIRSTGAHLLFLPPYSLDLNPIEKAFFKLKRLMRKAAETTWKPISTVLDGLESPRDMPGISQTQAILESNLIPL